MGIKLMGAILVVIGCGGFGVMMAVSHRREVKALTQLVRAVDVMMCELEYRLTPLPALCRCGAEQCSGSVRACMIALAYALESQISPDVGVCITEAMKLTPNLPKYAAAQFQALGQTLGRYDLTGQLTNLERCKQACLGQLEVLEHHQSQRLRSYQTLGFCAGAALAILLF